MAKKKRMTRKTKQRLEYEKVKERYNKLMFSLALEYRTVGTNYSEETENFTIEDMANECKYWHDTYLEDGHLNCELQKEDPVKWRSEKDRLWRFWNTWKGGSKI